MARVTETIPVKRHSIFLYEGDYARLRELHPQLGAAIVIRRLVRAFLNRIDSASPNEPLDLKGLDI